MIKRKKIIEVEGGKFKVKIEILLKSTDWLDNTTDEMNYLTNYVFEALRKAGYNASNIKIK